MNVLDLRSSKKVLHELEVYEGIRHSGRFSSTPPRRGSGSTRSLLSTQDIESLRHLDLEQKNRFSGSFRRGPTPLKKVLSSTRFKYSCVEETLPLTETEEYSSSSPESKNGPATKNEEKEEDEKELKQGKTVSFTDVHIHYHEIILGYNISVSEGAPIELSWKRFGYESKSIDDHARPSLRTTQQLKIPGGKRLRMCRAAGHSSAEILSRIEAVDTLRQQHVLSVKKAKVEERLAARQFARAHKKTFQNSHHSRRKTGKLGNVFRHIFHPLEHFHPRNPLAKDSLMSTN